MFFLSAVFLSACADDPLGIGFKREPRNFEAFYRELPLETFTMLGDSMLTRNNFVQGTTVRMLVGEFIDPAFGTVNAQIYSQIRPSNTLRSVEVGAVFDSVTLKLRIDNYFYGSKEATTQVYRIYEVTEELMNFERGYYNRSQPAIADEWVGRASVFFNPRYLEDLVKNNKQDTLLLSATLNREIGQRLFDIWSKNDSTFTDFIKFKKEFKGLALVPEQTDKVFGFNPASTFSVLELHYHVDGKKYSYPFYFDNVLNFNRVVSSRNESPLAIVSESKRNYELPTGLHYVQAGVGIFTRFNLDPLIKLRDTVPNIAFSSVEVEIPVEDFEEQFPPPNSLGLRLLKPDNGFHNSRLLTFSQFTLADANSDGTYVMNDASSAAALVYNAERKTYSGFITRFAQAFLREQDSDKRFPNIAIVPFNPDPGKSVNRLIFSPQKMKFKVYYTKSQSSSSTE